METEEIKVLLERLIKTSLLSAKEVFSTDDTMAYTGYSRDHLYRLIAKKEIPFHKRGNRIFFKKEELNNWLMEDEMKEEIEREAVKYCRRKKQERDGK